MVITRCFILCSMSIKSPPKIKEDHYKKLKSYVIVIELIIYIII